MLANKRTEAFAAVCKEAGVSFDCYELPERAIVDFDVGAEIARILEKHPHCDGVFATSDLTAAMVINSAAQMGRKIPEELKVVGYDGIFPGAHLTPTLTSIRQPIEAISRYMVEYLVRLINGETVPSMTVLPVKLVERGST